MTTEQQLSTIRLRSEEPRRFTRTGGWLVPVEPRLPTDSVALVILLAITVVLVGFAVHRVHRGYDTGALPLRGQLIDRLA